MYRKKSTEKGDPFRSRPSCHFREVTDRIRNASETNKSRREKKFTAPPRTARDVRYQKARPDHRGSRTNLNRVFVVCRCVESAGCAEGARLLHATSAYVSYRRGAIRLRYSEVCARGYRRRAAFTESRHESPKLRNREKRPGHVQPYFFLALEVTPGISKMPPFLRTTR